MKNRCENSHESAFDRYGGRGIVVEWDSFLAFLDDMGPRPGPDYSVERRNNNGNYSKDNCYWGTATDQANNKRTNHCITYHGEQLTLSQIAKRLSMNYTTVKYRVKHGLPLDVPRLRSGPQPKKHIFSHE